MSPIVGLGSVVLCGGQSRRMGGSKAWLKCGREYLLQRVVRLVSEVAERVVAANRPGQELPSLPPGVAVVYDTVADVGPLAGIAAGFDALVGRCETAFVVACDYPLLRPRFISRLVELRAGHEAVVPVQEGRLHPLAALYRLKTRAILADLLRRGTRRATEFAERCTPRLVRAEDFADCDPRLESLQNVNDPEEYNALLKRLPGNRASS